jgi:hypothetical protein
MAGKAWKPRDQLVGHRRNPAPIHLLDLPTDWSIPPCPEGLHPEGKRTWHLFWSSPICQLVQPVDIPVIERYAVCIGERARLNEQLAATDGTPDKTIIRLLKLYTDEISRCEERFGIGPLPRMRLGLSYAQAEIALSKRTRKVEVDTEPVWVTRDD